MLVNILDPISHSSFTAKNSALFVYEIGDLTDSEKMENQWFFFYQFGIGLI